MVNDLTGRTFSRLTVLDLAPSRNSKTYWICKCECGAETIVRSDGLVGGMTQSCGCLGRDRRRQANTKHGGGNCPEWKAWQAAKQRCYNPNNKRFHHYGGRGIKMCDRWLNSYPNFIADMGPRPSPNHSIDRINNDGNYDPQNCQWRTTTEQNNNFSANRRITFQGVKRNLTQWEKKLNFPRELIASRLKLGWTVEEALTTPVMRDINRVAG